MPDISSTLVPDNLQLTLDNGEPKIFLTDVALETDPNILQNLILETVPAGKTWRLRKFGISTRAYGIAELFIDDEFKARVTSGASSENPYFSFEPYFQVSAGSDVAIKFTQSHGPQVPLYGVLLLTET